MKLAFVAARYGADITQGPEHACRLLAEQLSLRHDVDVLTTCARQDGLWRNEYPEGTDRVHGVLVRRFQTSTRGHGGLSASLTARKLAGGAHARADEDDWVQQQGPAAPGLVEFIRRQQTHYDAVAYFGCRHATTIQALTEAPERSVLFPWLEVDPALRINAVRRALTSAAVIGLMSSAEQPLLEAYGSRAAGDEDVVGIGIQPPASFAYPRMEQAPAIEEDEAGEEPAAAASDEWDKPHLSGRGMPFRRRHKLDGTLAIYAGITGPGRGSEALIEYFDHYVASGGEAQLVVLGAKLFKVPSAPWLRQAGVLPARDRMEAYDAADVALVPSTGDLTGEHVLEAFATGTPVLVPASNLAAVEHCRRGGGGLFYANREEFTAALTRLMQDAALRARLGENGRRYVRQFYKWDAVMGRLERLLTRARGR